MDETQRRVWRFEALLPRSRRHHELQLQSPLLGEFLSNEHTSPPPLIHLDKVESRDEGLLSPRARGIVTQKNARLRIPPLPNAISELLSPPQLPRCDPR